MMEIGKHLDDTQRQRLRSLLLADLELETAHYEDALQSLLADAEEDIGPLVTAYQQIVEGHKAEIARRHKARLVPAGDRLPSIMPDVIRQVKERLDVVDFLGGHTELRKDGRTWKGLCPLHSETHPSFTVYPASQSWYCFGCQRGGDVIDFMQAKDGLDFWSALRELACQAGVEVPSPKRTRATVAQVVEVEGDEPPTWGWADVPDLPHAARLTLDLERAAQEVGTWLSDYMAYADAVSPMTPMIFHQSAGLWVAGLAIARRLRLNMPHSPVYPNLFILWVALTTLYAKSTGLDVAYRLARDAILYLLLANELTPEALMSELAGHEPSGLASLPEDDRNLWLAGRDFAAQRGILLDEAASLFASFRRDYNTGLAESFLRLYDCGTLYRRVTRGTGFAVVRNVYFSFIGATTPASLRRADVAALWESGFWPRFALLTPSEEPTWRRSEEREYPAGLADGLQRLAEVHLETPTYPDPPIAKDVILGEGVFQRWEVYDKAMRYDLLTSANKPDPRLWGVYGRLPTQALKVAMILAALDWSGNAVPVITLGHWARAQAIVEAWRASAHRLLEMLTEDGERGQENRIEELLREAGQAGATIRDLQRRTGQKRPEVESILNALVKDNIVEEVTYKPPRGRSTIRYRICVNVGDELTQ